MGEYKGAVKCDASALIRLGGDNFTNFANMQSAEDLTMLESTAPEFHRRVLNGIKASGKVKDSDVIEHTFRPRLSVKKLHFGKGASVKDVKKRKKGIIIAASVGYTKKSMTPVHRVCDTEGNTWIAKETDLKIVY